MDGFSPIAKENARGPFLLFPRKWEDHSLHDGKSSFLPTLKDSIYLFEGENVRKHAHTSGEWQAEGEADSLLSREPSVGLDPWTLRS